jgi:uncharacterized protein (TIGR02996 family)
MSLHDPDWITFRGRHRQLHSYPLEPYVRELPRRPEFRMRGEGRRRGYVASWEVRDDETLWLTGLTTRPESDGADPGLSLLFERPAPVPANWVSQPLWSPDIEQPRFSPLGNAMTFARESYLSVWNGRLVMVEEIDGKTNCRVGGELTPHLEGLFGPEEGSFLRAAFAAPDDVAPRLVYADWLDERHDPRGAVVRLAERLHRLPADAPLGERSADEILLRRGLNHWLWARLLGYDRLTTGLAAVIA